LFNSLRDSFLALAAFGSRVGAGVLALYFTGLDISSSSTIGFVSLKGVSVMDGILMISYYIGGQDNARRNTEDMYHAATHGLAPGGDLDRNRQPDAAAARHCGRRWHAGWTDRVAGGGAGMMFLEREHGSEALPRIRSAGPGWVC
jgi:AcrB/AcrD/AcrF family